MPSLLLQAASSGDVGTLRNLIDTLQFGDLKLSESVQDMVYLRVLGGDH